MSGSAGLQPRHHAPHGGLIARMFGFYRLIDAMVHGNCIQAGAGCVEC